MNSTENTLNEISILMGKIATICMLIPIIFALYNNKYLNTIIKIMLWFCIIRFIVSLLNIIIIWATRTYRDFFIPILNSLDIHNMNFISILAHLNYFGLLGWYFSLVIQNKKIKKIIQLVSIFLFFASIINFLFIEGYKNHNVFNSTSANIFCFLLPLIHLWFIFNEDSIVPIVKNPYFWISLGLIIPNLTGLITSIIGKKLAQTNLALYLQVDIGYAVLQILGYLLIAVGFYYARYTKYLPQNTPSVNK